MKFLKILLIIVLLLVMCSGISLGTGTIESGDKTVYFERYEEYNTLDEWFWNLSLREKIDVYTYWSQRVYTQRGLSDE
ncbi:hypothetical protein KAX08_09360 [candidate division WOR-3 bacterium]|nr:hypothetical protein [candidate division WOR-3 bacterium]